jgi:HD-GYP domain-containing protein (c-di-GMP phosphodiesterase class II)/CHASE2 domain-containing sensor protein
MTARASGTGNQPRGNRSRQIVVLCGAIPLFTAAILSVYRPGLLPRLDDTVYDTVMRSARTPPPGPHVVIIDVDERSLSTVGQWPWRRDVVAKLIGRLRDMGAMAVATDIIFAESDRYGEASADTARGAPGGAAPDDVLATTLREGRVVLGYALTFDAGGRTGKNCVLHPVSLAVLQRGEEAGEAPYFRATGAVCSLPALAQAAGRSGFLNAAPDSDGILRRVPLVAELDGRRYPSLGVAVVSLVTGARDLSLVVSNVNAGSLTIGDRVVPVDGRGNLLVRYRGKKKTFPYLSAADVLSGAVTADAIRGKVAFVGTTALGTREVVATPLDTLFAGVEVQATVADNLLERSFVQRSPHERLLDSILVIALGLAFALLFARTSVIPGLLTAAAGVVAVWWGSIRLLSSTGVFLSPLFSTIGVTSALIAMTFARFLAERRRAESAGREKTAAQKLMVQTLLSLTETRDLETGRHSRRTQQYARLLAQQLALNPDFRAYLMPERIELLSSLAPLHDIGKVGIPDHILNKPGALTPEELAEMRSHPVLGRDVILKAEQRAAIRDDATLAMAKDIVYTHHERWDGTGYPQGLRGVEIPVPGRVMGVVDVYDAAVSRTLYQPSRSHEDVVKLIVKGRGTHFDPAVVDAFLAVADEFKTLSDEERGRGHSNGTVKQTA